MVNSAQNLSDSQHKTRSHSYVEERSQLRLLEEYKEARRFSQTCRNQKRSARTRFRCVRLEMSFAAWNLCATKGWDVKNGSKAAPELRETAPHRTHTVKRRRTVVVQSPGDLTAVLQTPTVPRETNVKNKPTAR